jgi:hypothetical protein
MNKEDKIKEILKSIPWLENPVENLDFTAFLFYQALLDIRNLLEDN